MMVMLLRKLGYEILVASNGKECLEVIEREAARGRQHEIECILMVNTHSSSSSSSALPCAHLPNPL